MDRGEPGVKPLAQPYQRVRLGGKSLPQGLKQANPDRKLDQHRPQAAQWVHSALAVQLHRLLGNPRPIIAVPLLDSLHPRLKGAHGPHLPGLLQGQRQRGQPDQHGEGDDGEPELIEEDPVQQRQAVDHGVNNQNVEQGLQLTPNPWCLSARAW